MVRGLASNLDENDLREDIKNYGLQARDIRLIRKKETGTVAKVSKDSSIRQSEKTVGQW